MPQKLWLIARQTVCKRPSVQLHFFKHQEIKDNFKSSGIRLLSQKLNRLLMSENDRKSYEDYLAYLARELSVLDTAREEGFYSRNHLATVSHLHQRS